jgi:hypothetical protein
MSESKVPGYFVFPDPEELEVEARQFPALVLEPSVSSKWCEHRTPSGIRLHLPDGFEEIDSGLSDQATWQHADGSVVAVIPHEGGEYSMMFADSEGADVDWTDQGTFQVPIAGRVGKLVLARGRVAGHDTFLALATAGVSVGSSIAVLLAAPSPDRRDVLINVISTVTVNADDR